MSTQTGASTFSKGLRVLACFEGGQRNFSMAELAKCTGFDRAATRRLCLSLVEAGYLEKSGQRLSLSPKILSLAGAYLAVNDIGLSVQPVLDRFATELGYQVSFAIRDADRAIYLAESRAGASRLSFGFTVGSTLPLLHTAVGRMILCGCEKEVVDAIFERVIPHRYTDDTQLDLQLIRKQLNEAARQGYCFLQNEFEPGGGCAGRSGWNNEQSPGGGWYYQYT